MAHDVESRSNSTPNLPDDFETYPGALSAVFHGLS